MTDFVGAPCALSARGAKDSSARALESGAVWSYDTGGDVTRWIAFVRGSAAFRTILARDGRPIGYEVWRGSAE